MYKTNFKDEGVMGGIFSDNECITCEKCDNLVFSNYTVSVKAYNNRYKSRSNKVTFKPYGTVSFNYNIPNPIKD